MEIEVFKQNYQFQKTESSTILTLPLDRIRSMDLSIANRSIRNRTTQYQQKHLIGPQSTHKRPASLGQLNFPIVRHIELKYGTPDPTCLPAHILVAGVGDSTANLFRWSYSTRESVRLFYLDGEPLHEKKYFAFIVSTGKNRVEAQIKRVSIKNGKPVFPGVETKDDFFLFCSTPLVIDGEIPEPVVVASNNYDLRQTFGKAATDLTREIYFHSLDNTGKFSYHLFCDMIQRHRFNIQTVGKDVEWYHAGIGLCDEAIVFIHHIGSIFELAMKFKNANIPNAVLLDSGGSSVLWSNLVFPHILANQEGYYRPDRGAILIMELA